LIGIFVTWNKGEGHFPGMSPQAGSAPAQADGDEVFAAACALLRRASKMFHAPEISVRAGPLPVGPCGQRMRQEGARACRS
jgi:hypothetical protein